MGRALSRNLLSFKQKLNRQEENSGNCSPTRRCSSELWPCSLIGKYNLFNKRNKDIRIYIYIYMYEYKNVVYFNYVNMLGLGLTC